MLLVAKTRLGVTVTIIVVEAIPLVFAPVPNPVPGPVGDPIGTIDNPSTPAGAGAGVATAAEPKLVVV
jgi:hypothetical protein